MSLIYRILLSVFFLLILGSFAFMSIQKNPSEKISSNEIENKVSLMASTCWKLREIDTDSAVKIGLEALALAERHQIEREIPRICNFLGVVYMHYLYDSKPAIPFFHKALQYSISRNDSVQMGHAYNNLGDAFMLTGNAPLALEYAENSLNIFKELKHPSGIAYGYINLGLVYRLKKDYEESLRYFERAMEIRIEQGDEIGLASVLLELATTNKDKGDLELAMDLYEESYKHHMAINNVSYTSLSLNGIADVHYLKGDYEEALKYYNRSVTLDITKKRRTALIEDYFGLALVNAQMGNRMAGELDLKKAHEEVDKMNLPSIILKLYENYATFYKILDDYKMATASLDKFLTLYDSLLAIQKFQILNETQNNFFIKQNLNKAQHDIETNGLVRKYLMVIMTLMLVLISFIIWRLRVNRKLNNKLKLVNQSKDKLFSVISHDLKTPFNSLLGFSEILIENIKDSNYEDAGKYAKIINSSSKESLNLLTNLLNWSRSQTGRIEFKPEQIKLETIFIDLSAFFKNEAERYKINLVFKDEINAIVNVDPNILRVILTNLISNALKYTQKGGLINVGAIKQKSQIIINVQDNGIGMSAEVVRNFSNNKNTVSTEGLNKEKGTGLGLIICKDLIEIHRGKISVKSELGKGSVFQIELPAIL